MTEIHAVRAGLQLAQTELIVLLIVCAALLLLAIVVEIDHDGRVRPGRHRSTPRSARRHSFDRGQVPHGMA